MVYINYCFKNITYDDDFFAGDFACEDADVSCSFFFDRNTQTCEIWNNSHPVEDITPLPIGWLEVKLERNGKLNETEWKISY